MIHKFLFEFAESKLLNTIQTNTLYTLAKLASRNLIIFNECVNLNHFLCFASQRHTDKREN